MSDISEGFNGFVDKFRAQMHESVDYLTEAATRFSELDSKHADVCRDLERERVAARVTQQTTEKLEAELKELKEATIRAAFVLVLVDADADAYMFAEKYFAGDPAEGGARAALDLNIAVQGYLKSLDPPVVNVPVMGRAFASGEGLVTLFAKSGMIRPSDSQQVVSRFTTGFSQVDDMFDFVLVGKGKDRADYKVTSAFRHFAKNPACQHILLACCHDNGYVRMLEKFVHMPDIVRKVTLIKSFQTGSEFAALPFRSMTMEGVFRGHLLGLSAGPISKTKNGGFEPLVGAGGFPAHSLSSPAIPTTGFSPAVTYAVRAASQPTPSARPLPIFGTVDKSIILINADGHRIDMPLPPRSATVADSFKRKTQLGGKRFCNMYHLYGTCLGDCEFLHNPLTAGEKLVMRHKLRGQKCRDRGDCRDSLCLYGHHCTCPKTGMKCAFPTVMHGLDVASWREVHTELAV